MKPFLIDKGKTLLDEQLSAYGLDGLFGGGDGNSSGGVGGATPASDGMNRYQLGIDGVGARLSILCIEGYERLSEPWRFVVQFSAPCVLLMPQVLSKSAAIALAPGGVSDLIRGAFGLSNELMSAVIRAAGTLEPDSGSGAVIGETRALYGVVTSFSQLSSSNDEARYEVTVSPRLQLLDNTRGSAIYQNQTVPQVVEEVLRKHELTGVDFRFELAETYPVKEYLTQWEESDLTFIRRLLADSGIWFRFESHAEHGCDVVVFGDSVQQYQDGPQASYRQPTGNNDGGLEAVWDMSVARRTIPQSVLTQDYNYRTAQTGMQSEVNEQKKDATTRGRHYLYAEHYRERGEAVQGVNEQDDLLGQFGNRLGDDLDGASESSGENQEPEGVGQGAWYAKLRHQRLMTEQITITGKTTLSHLAPGQILTVNGSPISEASGGILIVSVESIGDRSQAYQLTFTGIPYDAMRPYRPELLAWPTIGGTLPARVTSPGNDQYGYMDSHGRYRVKMDFDLNDSWRKGEESLWMRRASVYAGDTYGLHFPLIDGTEVAIAFTGGNPDRPYISHAMHDSRHPELVTAANHKRNVIRTPANNKLRMDDERGKEHIKVATEYGKTQLNMGHVVDAERSLRGEGFELRTDEWGAIRAGKGLFIGAHEQEKARGEVLNIDMALEQLSAANNQMDALSEAAKAALALAADVQAQQRLLSERIESLKSAVILLSAPKGMALTSGEHLRVASGRSMAVTAGKNADISVMKRLTMAAGEAFSLFVQKAGIKLFAAKGKVEIQAQSDALELIARKGLSIISTEDEIIINAKKKITLNANGTYISLDKCLIELATQGDFKIKSASFDTLGPAAKPPVFPNVPNVDGFSEYFTLNDQKTRRPLSNFPYTLSWSGQDISGHTDESGNTQAIYTSSSETISVQPHPERVDRMLIDAAYWDDDTPLTLDFNKASSMEEGQA
ncbi:type VI secretion system tip protein VgrG [Leminorella grimontii]|uniref:type VI secretion system Vgr family protein n=1 Tax=Leminorella grimontii TaxID=82981 RepID=UPI00321F8EC0